MHACAHRVQSEKLLPHRTVQALLGWISKPTAQKRHAEAFRRWISFLQHKWQLVIAAPHISIHRGFFRNFICLSHFFRDFVQNKRATKFLTKLYYTLLWVCHDVSNPFSKFWDLDTKLGGYWVCVIRNLFFKNIWKTLDWIQDSRWTLSLNSLIQPKGRRLLHMECDCSSHPIYEDYHPRASRLLEQEHHAASVQPRKYSEGKI